MSNSQVPRGRKLADSTPAADRATRHRRSFLAEGTVGLSAAVLGNLVGERSVQAATGAVQQRSRSAADGLHFPAQAKRVIFLFMAGAPSQLDLFDPKPGLVDQFRKPLPDDVVGGQRVTAMTQGKAKLIAPSKFKFDRRGQSGIAVSELLPHLGRRVDDLCFIRSMHTDAINHDPAKTLLCTGSELPGKASMGAWLSYGLGRENEDLPEFVVLNSAYWTGGNSFVQALYSRLWGSGFLPSRHQGVAFQSAGDPVLFLSDPPGVSRQGRRMMMDMVSQMNTRAFDRYGDPEIRTTIEQQEMAFRMQASVPQLTDLGDENETTLKLYGDEVHKPGSFARNCLLARRMAERGVRFIQLFHRGWDHHVNLPGQLPGQAFDIDQPCAALIQDLKQRGLLDDTLVVFSGEFGRTTFCQGNLTADNYGRDHHPRCFTAWMAGGGIRGGMVHGETDDYSYNIVRDPVHVRDFNATILHQLGIDHTRLTYPFMGLDQKLTGVEEAHVVRPILG